MIPVNNVNQEAVAQQQEQQFNEEIERLETAIFAEKWYHNTYFGYTKLYEVLVAKARFTDSQRLEMNYQDEWSRPWGPGGEQWKAELV